MYILNLTQHAATSDQVAAGVREPTHKELVQKLLTFEDLPSSDDLWRRAQELALYVFESGYRAVMIGGAPFFMPVLEVVLREMGIKVLYAFSKRESVEETQGGITKKAQVFRHVGFYEAT